MNGTAKNVINDGNTVKNIRAQNSDCERVFSYARWEIIHGQTPLWTDQDRAKFKDMDGQPVKKMNTPVIGISGQAYMCISPYGGPMFLGTHDTRMKGEKDIPAEILFSNKDFINSVLRGMAVEIATVPYDFRSLAYIDNLKTKRGWFAMVQLHSSQVAAGEYPVFNMTSKRVAVPGDFRSFMLDKITQYKATIPHGYLKQNSESAVFWLSYDRIIECMQDYYLDLKFEFETEPEQVAQKYFKLVGGELSEQRDVCKKQYEKNCESILEKFSKLSRIHNDSY